MSSREGRPGALRVLHCPTTCGGNPQQLARAERELGLESWSVAFGENPFGYDVDELVANRLAVEAKRWGYLWRALRDYDVVHFNYGRSLFPALVTELGPGVQRYGAFSRLYHAYARILGMNDLPLLKRAGKGIVVTFQGGDARQSGYEATTFGADRKRWVVDKFSRYADRIFYLNPDLGRFLPTRARFVPYANIDLREWQPAANGVQGDRRITVLHAPSARAHKGTNRILEVVEELRREGVDFEFLLAEGLSRDEARKLYERSDLVIDQLLAGWYGGFAVEMMALSKPVICHIREEDLRFIPQSMRDDLPVVSATSKTLHEVLKRHVTMTTQELTAIGTRGRAYVETWHDPLTVAGMLKDEYETIMAAKREQRRPRSPAGPA